MLPLGIGKQLRGNRHGVQSRWKTVVLILFLSINSLALLMYASPWKPSPVTKNHHRPVPYPRPGHQDQAQYNEDFEEDKSSFQYYENNESSKTKEDIFGYQEGDIVNSRDSIKISLPRKGVLNYDLQFIHNPELLCRGKQVSLLIGVCSAVQRFDLREAIRKTWGSVTEKKHLTVKVVFVLGSLTERHAHLQNIVDEESQRYEDIIQPDLVDHYANLSLKTLGMFHWAQKYCPTAKYVMKTDDDVFINVPNLLSDLTKMVDKGSKFMMGHVIQGARPITDRQDKWFMPTSLFSGRTYPTYLSGSAYVFPHSLIRKLMEQTKQTSYFWLEDVYITGMLARDVDAALISNPKFLFRKASLSPCSYKLLIAGHEVTHSEMYKVWKEMHRADLDCSTVDLHFTGQDVFSV